MLSPRERADAEDCELADVGVIGREPDEVDAGGVVSEALDLALPLL